MVSDGVTLTYDEDRIQVAPLLLKQMGCAAEVLRRRRIRAFHVD
jgi:hypothetical protein